MRVVIRDQNYLMINYEINEPPSKFWKNEFWTAGLYTFVLLSTMAHVY